MNSKHLTIESIDNILSTPDGLDNEEERATRAILSQLRGCLEREQNPKVIQLEAMEDNGIFALKSDGTIHHTMGGQRWLPFKTP